MTPVRSGLVAMAISLAVAPLVLTALRRGQVIDRPSARSSHLVPVPRGGGLAVAIGALIALALTPALPVAHKWAIAVAAAGFGLLGTLDDTVGVSAFRKLGIQFVLGVVAAFSLLGDATGSVVWSALSAAGLAFWLVAFVNAFNFMDGIDGISVAQAVVAGVTWFLVGTHTDTLALAAGGAVIAGAAIGFAPFNVPRARMFLGDTGSYFMGAWLAAVAFLGVRSGVPVEAVLAPLALYVAYTGVTLVRRLARGERWYLPHRQHTYQQLCNRGWTHLETSALVATCVAACGALGAVSLAQSRPARLTADVAVAAMVAAYLLAPKWLAPRTRRPAVTVRQPIPPLRSARPGSSGSPEYPDERWVGAGRRQTRD